MAGKNTQQFTDSNFDAEVLKSSTPVLVDFWAVWCGPCRALSPVIDELADQYAGQVKVGKVNTDESPNTPAQYGVRGIPTIIVFKNGQVFEQSVGVIPKAQLAAILDRALK